nr:putative reverse transcriptase, RNA-dependent DNA polymerase, Gag-polypeptide of LTR copia-type [Tanacetum cinerariifolium]
MGEVRCDDKRVAYHSHKKGIRDSVKYANTSSEIWSDLKERFGKESAPRAYELKKKITATRQEGSIVSTYYTRLRSLWDESHSNFSFPCCSCNKCTCELGKKIIAHLEKQKLYEFLIGLDSDFNVIRTQILATKPVPTLGTAYHMARLVAKGCTQREGVDYHETFAPVAKLVTVRTLLVVATKKGWIIHQLHVNNAFLHGDLDEEVYMKIPQASRNWYKKLTSFLLSLNFKQSKADYFLFTYQKAGVYVVILIYVDDVIIVGDNSEKIQQIKQQLGDEFSIKNLGPLKYFLGIEVAKTSDGLVLSQRKYILDILKDSEMLGCRPSVFPFDQGTKLDKGEEEARVDATQYRRLVGRLLYLQATRPDVTYAINVLSQFVSDPRQNHLEAAKRVLRYLKGTPGKGILLPREGPTTLTAYCHSDWLGCPFTRRSKTGYLLLFSSGPISWKTKKHSVVSRSSAEAEYRAMASTVSEIIWVRWLLKDMQVQLTTPTSLFCDNQAARHIANNPVYHERTKHVEMDCFLSVNVWRPET